MRYRTTDDVVDRAQVLYPGHSEPRRVVEAYLNAVGVVSGVLVAGRSGSVLVGSERRGDDPMGRVFEVGNPEDLFGELRRRWCDAYGFLVDR